MTVTDATKKSERMAGIEDYTRLLERWVRGAKPYLYVCPDRPELACYGTGENGWGVQTNQKAFAAFAVLAEAPQFDERRAGISRLEVRETALSLLRYSLHTHLAGTYTCTDGTAWGNTWISVLGMERMMHGVEAVEGDMTDEERLLLRRVMLSECDWLLDHYEIVAGLTAKEGRNKPESNLWNGAFLHRTAIRYPDAPRAGEYREKGTDFLINSVSVPADESSEEIVDGRKVSERYVGANFFPSMALNHHGYLNVGYMVICLSNMAMLHFDCLGKGIRAPESLYRHARELWDAVKTCTFPDGRLLRIGGDTRIRYTYCQDYVIPVWHMIANLFGDAECAKLEDGWLRQIVKEMDASGDGTFLSFRCGALLRESPLYFTRLESDRAAALSMGLAWRELAYRSASQGASAAEAVPAVQPMQPMPAGVNTPFREPEEVPGTAGSASPDSWHDAYHGAYLHRGKQRIASWVWESAEKPQGLIVPAGSSDMAEWCENLSGQLQGYGLFTEQKLDGHTGHLFPGGFVTSGSTILFTRGLLAEGQQDQELARSRLVCAALPDDTHMLVLQYAAASGQRTMLRSVKGLNLLIPNDLFNGGRRDYYHEHGGRSVTGLVNGEEIVSTGSRWLNVDDKLGVVAAYGTDGISIHSPGRRNVGLKTNLRTAGLEKTLYADTVCGPCRTEAISVPAGEPLLDTGYLLQAGLPRQKTAAYAGDDRLLSVIRHEAGVIRAVSVRGADGHLYVLAANFGTEDGKLPIPLPGAAADLVTGEELSADLDGTLVVELAGGTARLLRMF
ncbi:MAG: hypothetical protein K0Q94_3268 [Paenibacillus sp.]|nr:hypothetical protein [Paenibacillus sp.]